MFLAHRSYENRQWWGWAHRPQVADPWSKGWVYECSMCISFNFSVCLELFHSKIMGKIPKKGRKLTTACIFLSRLLAHWSYAYVTTSPVILTLYMLKPVLHVNALFVNKLVVNCILDSSKEPFLVLLNVFLLKPSLAWHNWLLFTPIFWVRSAPWIRHRIVFLIVELIPFLEDLQDPLELTPQKDVLFIRGDWNAKVGSQETPGVTGKFGLGIRNEAGQRLIEFCQENALVIADTLFQQHKRRLYTRTSPDGQYQNQIDSIFCSQRWRSSI